jgi:hypothetical protein
MCKEAVVAYASTSSSTWQPEQLVTPYMYECMSGFLVHWKTDKEYRAGCMIQHKASHVSHRLWSKSGSSKCRRARTDDEQALESSKRWAIRRLEQLGFAVTLTPKDLEEEVA